MPKEVELADGTMMNVYDETEVAEIKASAEGISAQMEKLKTDLEIKDGETIEDKLASLKEQANPNFGKYRAKFSAMEKELKAGGKEFDDYGNVISGQKVISMEEIEKMTTQAAQNALFQEKRNALLSRVPTDSRETVNTLLSKLEATGGTLEENFNLAIAKALPGQNIDPIHASLNSGGSGAGPRIATGDVKNFTDTDEGKALLNQIIPPVKSK